MKLKQMVVVNDINKAPYLFRAQYTGLTDEYVKTIHDVYIVMPIGGSQSALYRYPKKEEIVLVGIDDDGNHYLLGYLPGKPGDNIYTGENDEAVLDQAGQFFRFKGSSDHHKSYYSDRGNPDSHKKLYSEIGFYNESPKNFEKTERGKEFKPVDTLKIQSTGDIYQKAENHHQSKAKRFEFLANCSGNQDTEKDEAHKEKERPFGDYAGDDSDLHEGDVFIRADNRIVLKAGRSIELRVGRSSILIDDTVISLRSKKSHNNWTNGWDTRIDLWAIDGLTMFGQWVMIRAGLAFELSEMYGTMFKSQLGIARLEAMDLKLSTLGNKLYTKRGHANAADIAVNAGTMGMGILEGYAGDEKSSHPLDDALGFGLAKYAGYASSHVIRLIARALLPKWTGSKSGCYDYKDKLGLFADIGTMLVWGACFAVGMLFDTLMADRFKEDPKQRDEMYAALSVIEYGFNCAVFFALAAANKKGMIHESAIHLSGTSKITLDAHDVNIFNINEEEANSPLAGNSKKKEKEEALKKEKAAQSEALKTEIPDIMEGLYGTG